MKSLRIRSDEFVLYTHHWVSMCTIADGKEERGQVQFLREEQGWAGRPSGNGIERDNAG
jgi:hypothetical protein